MEITIISVSAIERSVKSIFLIILIFLFRKKLNMNSVKSANTFLWIILIIYLIVPYSFLITIKTPNQYGLLNIGLQIITLISKYTRIVIKKSGYALSRVNQVIVASILIVYTITQIIKRNKVMKKSQKIYNDKKIDGYINLFKFTRNVDIFINDSLYAPITYGIIHPKIIFPSKILQDEELIKYVLIHELIHIKKYDIIFSHFKNFIACLHWYNLFVLVAAKYIENDIEVFCDKLVIKKIGDNEEHRKQYCIAMLKLIEVDKKKNKGVLWFNPTIERMRIMKKWRNTRIGTLNLIIMLTLSLTVFADVKSVDKTQIISSQPPKIEQINKSNMVNIITDTEYNQLELEKNSLAQSRVANIDDKVSLEGLANKKYKFNMASWTEPNHDGFTVKMSEMSCSDNVSYKIIIQENGNIIYKENFLKATILTVKAHHNSRYKVTIVNDSVNTLNYRIKINSYIR